MAMAAAVPISTSTNLLQHHTTRIRLAAKATDRDNDDTKPSSFTNITNAFDFSQVRSQEDADLLDEASDTTQSGQKMNRQQYAALRRKIGGTYKDFFKESVDVSGAYIEDGWVDKRCTICGKDTSSSSTRSKDKSGKYAHDECLTESKSKSGNFFTRLFGMK